MTVHLKIRHLRNQLYLKVGLQKRKNMKIIQKHKPEVHEQADLFTASLSSPTHHH